MGAIVRVTTTTPEAFAALLDVVQTDGIYAIDLGENSGMHEVVFSSANVAMGTGFTTLQGLMNEHTAGAGDGLRRVEFG